MLVINYDSPEEFKPPIQPHDLIFSVKKLFSHGVLFGYSSVRKFYEMYLLDCLVNKSASGKSMFDLFLFIFIVPLIDVLHINFNHFLSIEKFTFIVNKFCLFVSPRTTTYIHFVITISVN